MKKLKIFLKVLTLIIFLIYFLNLNYNFDEDFLETFLKTDFENLVGNLFNNNYKEIPVEENSNIFEVYFCPKDNCSKVFNYYINKSQEEILCALYDFDLESTISILNNKSNFVNITIIIDEDNSYFLKKNSKDNINIITDKYRNSKYDNYMHHKFCIIDKKIVTTGSMNPTYNGVFKNNNDLLIINSTYLSKNYFNEFKELKDKKFGADKSKFNLYNPILLNVSSNIYEIKSYFCPNFDCEEIVNSYLKSANRSIYFSIFVITSDIISNRLVSKKKEGLDVKGVIEKRNQNILGSDYDKIKNFTKLDYNKYTMHHKFFIIDNETVITGSMNPTKSGSYYNDENILIIKNKNLAEKYIDYFYSEIYN